MKKLLAEYAPLLGIGAVIVILDQFTKNWVRSTLDFMEIYRPDLWITEYARIMHWKNTGAAFGMFDNMGQVFLILSLLVTIAILYYYPRIPKEDWLLRLAMGLLFGGALGNMLDRIMHDFAVTDFISVLNFPVFNIADASISIGVAILFVSMLWQEYKERKAAQTSPETQAADQNRASGGEENSGENPSNALPAGDAKLE